MYTEFFEVLDKLYEAEQSQIFEVYFNGKKLTEVKAKDTDEAFTIVEKKFADRFKNYDADHLGAILDFKIKK